MNTQTDPRFGPVFGIDRLIHEPALRRELSGMRVGVVAHPASVTPDLIHSIDLLSTFPEFKVTAAFGPQHGMRGEKQDNMVESETYFDPRLKIPVYSLYGEVRRPKPEMLENVDVVLIDLQDVGCRIYTFITTLLYVMEECSKLKKSVWVLDRPNPAGRPAEGTILEPGWESFVGAGPILMRHGLTLGELALWFKDHFKLPLDLKIIEMKNYDPNAAPGWGWPLGQRSWINPSPNAPNLSMVRAYSGTVLLEGTLFSEGRGTTRPLEVMGSPDIQAEQVLGLMRELAPHWLKGCRIRTCFFEPTFHKHHGKLCQGLQMHVDDPAYDHAIFKPYRIQSLFFKACRLLYPKLELWRDFHYEYEKTRLAIDLIHGGTGLRNWVEDTQADTQQFDAILMHDEQRWHAARTPFLLYPDAPLEYAVG